MTTLESHDSNLNEDKNPRPCIIHSQEEMIAAVLESTAQIERGEYLTSEEMDREIKSWFSDYSGNI